MLCRSSPGKFRYIELSTHFTFLILTGGTFQVPSKIGGRSAFRPVHTHYEDELIGGSWEPIGLLGLAGELCNRNDFGAELAAAIVEPHLRSG